MDRGLDHSQLYRELVQYLALFGPATAVDAMNRLGISQPVFSRLIGRNRDDLLIVGRARSTRYAARRDVPSVGRSVPVYEVEDTGDSRRLAILHAKQPRGYHVEALVDDIQSGFFNDLPYFLHDLRPAGFLGRLIPRRHPELEVPQDIRLWTADDCLKYLIRYGWNPSGNLIVGEEAFRLYLSKVRTPPDPVEKDERARRYSEFANDVLSAGEVGSSAAGEQPKFLLVRAPDPVAVLVKFSPPVRDESSQRLADLLVCEHLVHNVLRAHDLPAPKSEIIISEERIFIEVERFDRLPGGGRRGLLSLAALDAEFVGRMRSWSDTAAELVKQGQIDEVAYRQILWLECFGRLIANTDMHPDNLSFHTRGTRITGLAPAYDMLPMMYAPQHGHLMNRGFSQAVPRPTEFGIWEEVCRVAKEFWLAVSRQSIVSGGFRRIARSNASEIDSLSQMGRMLPR